MTYIPKTPSTYQGNQVIIDSGRLVFNAKLDSILLYSNKAIGFSTNGSFHFDTSPNKKESKFIVNSPNIYLGLNYDSTLPEQPAVLANDLIRSLEDILDLIDKAYFDMAFNVSYLTTTEGEPTAINDKNFHQLRKRQREIERVKNELQDIKSQNTKLV